MRVAAVGGKIAKVDRIRRLLPLFESGRITLPPSRMRTLHDGRTIDVIDAFIQEELLPFPVGTHDDLVDAIARVLDPDIQRLLKAPESDMERSKRIASLPNSYLGNYNGKSVSNMSMWQRHKAKVAGSGQVQRPRARPQESGIWAKPGWK
jgi:hypothetical protein